MAEPFSIIAVTQTGLSVAQALTKPFQRLTHARREAVHKGSLERQHHVDKRQMKCGLE